MSERGVNTVSITVGLLVVVALYLLNNMPGILSFALGTLFMGGTRLLGWIPSVADLMEQFTDPLWSFLTAGMKLSSRPSVTKNTSAWTTPRTVRDVQQQLRGAGLEKCSLIVGIDFTKSNLEQGYHTYQGRSLHALDFPSGQRNPYQQVIASVGDTLAVFDDDGLIPAFAFGDKVTGDRSVFPLGPNPASGFEELLAQYAEVARSVKMDGPTSFAPLIRRACEIVREANNEFHILVVITDGAVNDVNDETVKAIVEASHSTPLSIIAVGVGDGPWDEMERFDNDLPDRTFDNFTFVNYEQLKHTADGSDLAFVSTALRETPEQFKAARQLGLLRSPAEQAAQRKQSSRKGRKREDY